MPTMMSALPRRSTSSRSAAGRAAVAIAATVAESADGRRHHDRGGLLDERQQSGRLGLGRRVVGIEGPRHDLEDVLVRPVADGGELLRPTIGEQWGIRVGQPDLVGEPGGGVDLLYEA